MLPKAKTSGNESQPHWLYAITIGRKPLNTLVRVAVLIVTCVVVFHFILLPIRVAGISMMPTYSNGAFNFVNRLAYEWHQPQRGDVVGIRFAGVHVMLLKRIVGLPGETVAFVNGKLIINGQPLVEPYEKTECDWNVPPVTLKSDEYFVVGDNRTMPQQDHVFGRVERYRIVGKVLW